MEDINSLTLVARLTSDPELRTTSSGLSLSSLRVAFNSSTKENGQWVEKGNFVNVSVWGQQAETCAKYLHKGSRIIIKGRLAWSEWEGEQGKRSEVSVTADRVQFLDPPPEKPAPQQVPAAAPANDQIPF